MENILLIVHVVVALGVIGLIMIQQGKGAEMGASFGSGSSQTVFGAAGTGNLFSKLTAILIAIFFGTSFTLAVIAKNAAEIGDDFDIPAAEVVQPAEDDSLAVPADTASQAVEETAAPE